MQVDALDIRSFPLITLRRFTARDEISRWDEAEVRRRATATTAKEFVVVKEYKELPGNWIFVIKKIRIKSKWPIRSSDLKV